MIVSLFIYVYAHVCVRMPHGIHLLLLKGVGSPTPRPNWRHKLTWKKKNTKPN